MKIITRMRTGGHRMGKSKKKYTEATAMHAVPFHVKATKIWYFHTTIYYLSYTGNMGVAYWSIE
jgi:hypothetical protein